MLLHGPLARAAFVHHPVLHAWLVGARTEAGGDSLLSVPTSTASKLFVSTERVTAMMIRSAGGAPTLGMDDPMIGADRIMLPGGGIAAAASASAASSGSPLDQYFWLADDTNEVSGDAVAAVASTVAAFQIPEIITNIAVGVTALLFLAFGITYLAAALLIPAGAAQLELECTQIMPDVWQEYLKKLDDGQQMKDRPDLMFELGLKLNAAKAEQLRKVCAEYYPDLWDEYQTKLMDDQELKDRPELIDRLSRAVGARGAAQMKAIAPTELWTKYEELALTTEVPTEMTPVGTPPGRNAPKLPLEERPDLLLALSQEMGYQDMFALTRGMGVQAVATASASTTTTGGQWGDDDDEED